jgi:ribosomal protein S18 acetylase RimI-like enzyme
MIMKIIPFEEKYRNDAERICVDTGDKDNMINPEHRRFSVLMYCDEYIKYETVYLLVNDEDKAVGYIMCAKDYKSFEKHMTPYLEQIRKECPNFAERADIREYTVLQEEYPAHMHIDIEEEYTGGGRGSALMNTLLDDCRKSGVKGLMLGVDGKNTRAVGFYKKSGFKVLYDSGSGYLMGIRF